MIWWFSADCTRERDRYPGVEPRSWRVHRRSVRVRLFQDTAGRGGILCTLHKFLIDILYLILASYWRMHVKLHRDINTTRIDRSDVAGYDHDYIRHTSERHTLPSIPIDYPSVSFPDVLADHSLYSRYFLLPVSWWSPNCACICLLFIHCLSPGMATAPGLPSISSQFFELPDDHTVPGSWEDQRRSRPPAYRSQAWVRAAQSSLAYFMFSVESLHHFT